MGRLLLGRWGHLSLPPRTGLVVTATLGEAGDGGTRSRPWVTDATRGGRRDKRRGRALWLNRGRAQEPRPRCEW